jgi:PAS domain S-box-containing protein
MFMMIEKHRTEYKLIDQVINELTQVMQRIETLEASAEENQMLIQGLHQSVMIYRKGIESLSHRMFIKDVYLAYVFCNETYAHDLSIKPDEISGKTDYDFFSKDLAEKIIAEETEILSSGVKKEMEEKYVVCGKELTVLATKTPVRNDNGDIFGLQVMLRDITEDKRREEQQASQLRSLAELRDQEKTKSDALSMDLERMTVERNQLQTEIKDMQVNMKKQTVLRDAEREKLREDLQRETAERKEAVERLRKSFTQIQDLMNSVQSLMGPSNSEDQ